MISEFVGLDNGILLIIICMGGAVISQLKSILTNDRAYIFRHIGVHGGGG